LDNTPFLASKGFHILDDPETLETHVSQLLSLPQKKAYHLVHTLCGSLFQ
jgi:hypothetical protein